ncbi:MAG: DUF2924 domain-containing protein [Magnetococcales bacterium]|nr:DUF2924 domain-containing protein [Magnetococcales bacterium]
MRSDTLQRVAALPGMSAAELKKMWKELCQSEPPPYNKAFLVKRLAYRIQELAHGGLSERSEKRLERLAAEEESPPEKKRPPGERLLSGTRLVREWKGVEHCCTVLDDGFEYQGRRFGSLSAVATAITSTKWNGLVFFALKKQGDKA